MFTLTKKFSLRHISKKADPNKLTYRGRYSEGAAAKEPMQLFTKNTGLC